jgi:hypothetical protein
MRGFGSRWQAKRDASGQLLGDLWPGFGKHATKADAIASAYADKPAALDASLDAYFASDDPFLAKVRWNFATWASDPERWARDQPRRGGWLPPAKHDADVATPVTDELFFRKERARA